MEAEGEVEFNLLQRFGGDGDEAAENAGANDMGEIELSLGLSLGGCFGVESKGKKLIRASSISTLSMFHMEMDHAAAAAPLTRTCSLPVEMVEERRKRKEMQSLKRLEAKRKRSEKRAAAGAKDRKEESFDNDLNKAEVGGGQFVVGNNKMNGFGGGGEIGKWVGARPNSQGSIGSQGSSSSGVSEFESRPMQGLEPSGLGNCTEVRSPSMIPLPNTTSNETNAHAKLTRDLSNSPSKKNNGTSNKSNGVKELERNMMEEMPFVSTKFDGPIGRRIEGFLYKYRKGEEVRIVCVCHGSFLTPAEFVKHAGGGDVAHPLRHIVVNSAPLALL